MPYSLHTEYSHGPRDLNRSFIDLFPSIRKAHRYKVPQLWYDEQWVDDFVKFIQTLVNTNDDPSIIEIHPPFKDYCPSIEDFLLRYRPFEDEILSKYPETNIVIENRCGTHYRGDGFLISNEKDIVNLCQIVDSQNLKLKMVVDFPQIFTSHNLTIGRFTIRKIEKIIRRLKVIREDILGIHIWGKKYDKNGRPTAHVGTLDTYFAEDSMKSLFLEMLYDLLNDGKQRYFIPEVNGSNEDLSSIISDFVDFGFKFI